MVNGLFEAPRSFFHIMYSLKRFVEENRTLFGYHLVALVLAIIVGVLSGIPQYFMARDLGDGYHGIPLLFQDSEAVYLTRIHELEDGHREVASPFLHEYKDGSSIVPPTGEWVYFILSKLSGLPLSTVVTWSKYVFPAALFLLIYAFVFLLGRGERDSRLLALGAASAITLGFELLNLRHPLQMFVPPDTLFLTIWTRLVNPIIGGLLLFGFLISVWWILRDRYLAWVPATLFLAGMMGYIFSFGLAGMILGVFAVATLCTREYKKFWVLILIGLGAIAIHLPHLLSILPGISGSSNDGIKNGLFFTREPLFNVTLIAALVVLSAGLIYDRIRKVTLSITSPQVFCFLLLVSGFLVMNQQVITGRTVWPHHFVQYTVPVAIISVFIAVFVYVRPMFPRLWRAIPLSAILFSVVVSVIALPSYAERLSDYNEVNRYAGALAWLQNHPGDCVVIPAEQREHFNPYITAFTRCDVYYTHYTYVGIPEERIRHNILVQMAILGVSPENAESYLREHKDRVRAVLFRDWKDLFRHSPDGWLTRISDREEIDEWVDTQVVALAKEYQEFVQGGIRNGITKYRADYVMWDREGDTPFSATQFPFLEQVFEEEGIVIYRIN